MARVLVLVESQQKKGGDRAIFRRLKALLCEGFQELEDLSHGLS